MPDPEIVYTMPSEDILIGAVGEELAKELGGKELTPQGLIVMLTTFSIDKKFFSVVETLNKLEIKDVLFLEVSYTFYIATTYLSP